MDLEIAEKFAREVIAEHLGPGWSFGWDNAFKRAGQTRFSDKTITLSRRIIVLWPEEEVLDTLLHEVAHALVGPGHGHDAAWRAMCRTVGARPERCSRGDLPRVPMAYKGTCPNGHVSYRRKPLRPGHAQSCGVCCRSFDRRYLITWTLA